MELKPKPDWLKPLFPWEQQALTVNGRTMAYLDEGERAARPVLLLSGNPTWAFLYRDFIRPLTEAGYRAIAPDWSCRRPRWSTRPISSWSMKERCAGRTREGSLFALSGGHC